MREETVTRTIYKFDELSKAAKSTATSNNIFINTEHAWWDSDYEWFKSIATILGIDIDQIYFTGFASQGDGACFTGLYGFNKESLKQTKKNELPKEIEAIAITLYEIQKRNHRSVTAKITQNGMYYHALTTSVKSVIELVENERYTEEYLDEVADDKITELLQDFMQWMYVKLEESYDYLTTDEAVIQAINANEMEFLESGEDYENIAT